MYEGVTWYAVRGKNREEEGQVRKKWKIILFIYEVKHEVVKI